MKRILIALVLVGLAGVVPARAGVCESVFVEEPPEYQGSSDRVIEHENISGAPVPMNVLLPPSYDDEPERRYPVLYLLGGWAQTHNAWLNATDVEGVSEQDPAMEAIVVLPWTGEWVGWWIDVPDQPPYEAIFINEVVPFIDRTYRTIADREHRAVAGMSGGGISSGALGVHNPDLFTAIGFFSGAVDTSWPSGEAGAFGFNRAIWACLGFASDGISRDPVTMSTFVQDLNIIRLAGHFRGAHVYASAGTGMPCDERDWYDLTNPRSRLMGVVHPGEGGFVESTKTFDRALTAAGVEHTTVLRPCGLHSWRYFEEDLRAFWLIMFETFGSEAPPTFDHARTVPRFTVWDWSFTADPARAPEFLDVADALCDGLGLSGSGLTTVRTARCFTPGASVLVDDVEHTADAEGRLTFTVDLGPAHQFQQYTPAARALEAAGGYWTSKAVTFEEVEA